MNIPSGEMPRLRKLKALAERGATPGERQAARDAMDRIMAKYGYRRKAAADPDPAASSEAPAPDPMEMSMEDLAKWCANAGRELNEMLPDIMKATEKMARDLADLYTKLG